MAYTFDSVLFFHNQQNGYVYSSKYGKDTVWPSGPYGGRKGLIELTNDCVASVYLTNAGSGYTAPTVYAGIPWSAGLGVNIGQQLATSGGNLYTVLTVGTTGSTMPTFTSGTATDGTTTLQYAGKSASIGAEVISGAISTLTVYSGGSGYTTAPPINFVDSTGISASATCLLNAFPSGELVPGVAYLDTYIVVGRPDGRLYNSGINDPTTWNALSYLTSESEPNRLTGICKHLNYVVAFSEWSTNFFFDAGISYPASPLLPAAPYGFEIGCINGTSIAQFDNSVAWIGQAKSTGPAVFILNGTSPTKVSTPYIDRVLSNSNLEKILAYCFKYNGHMFYVLTLHDLNKTLVFDVNEQVWMQWTMYALNPDGVTYSEQYFRPGYYSGNYGPNVVYYLLDDDNGSVYTMSDTAYQDHNAPIYFRSVTPINDNGTTKRKFYGRLEIIGDKTPGTMLVRHTGDDYNNWSNYRAIDLNANRSQIYCGGSDRRRAWEFLCTDNVPLRLEAAEIDVNIGEMDQEQFVGGGRR